MIGQLETTFFQMFCKAGNFKALLSHTTSNVLEVLKKPFYKTFPAMADSTIVTSLLGYEPDGPKGGKESSEKISGTIPVTLDASTV